MKASTTRRYLDFITGRFSGRDVHIVASGPSLAGFDYSYFQDKTVIAVNHSYKKTPFDFKVFSDRSFVRKEDPASIDNGFSLCPAKAHGETDKVINFAYSSQYQEEPGPVYGMGSSGLVALTIALQGGASRVFLWGYDYTFQVKDGQTVHHATQGEFMHRVTQPAQKVIYETVIPRFRVYPANRVFNMSPESAIPYFPKLLDRP